MTKIIIIILLLLGTGTTYAQSDIDQFKKSLEAVSSKNRTINSDFVQEKLVKNIKQPIKSEGKFYYDNSGLMALVYQSPKGDKLIMSGDNFTIIASGKKRISDASSNPMMSQISSMMRACMSGDVSKLGRGWGMDIKSVPEGYRVVLTPSEKRIQKYITSMMMCFDTQNLTLNSLRIEEASGGYTEYFFFNKSFNTPIDHSVFNAE